MIAIFTKYDELITRADWQMDGSLRARLDEERLSELLKKDADAALKKTCTIPFEKHVKKKVPHITVSCELFVLLTFLASDNCILQLLISGEGI